MKATSRQILLENLKGMSDSFVRQCSHILCRFTYVRSYIHVVLCPSATNPGDATAWEGCYFKSVVCKIQN